MSEQTCKHQWVCGLDQQQCMEDCHGEHDPAHLICKECGVFKSHLAGEQTKVEVPERGHDGLTHEERMREMLQPPEWTTWGIIELAVRNPNVQSYMEHWEARALKAEAENRALKHLLEASYKVCPECDARLNLVSHGPTEVRCLHCLDTKKIDDLAAENRALKQKVERLTAPVSDEEWDQHDQFGYTFAEQCSRLIAARAERP